MRKRFGKEQKENSEQKILDVDASMQGTLSFKDPVNLRINGDFEGKLETKGILTISKNANVVAEISGEIISIAGQVKGNIVATKELIMRNPGNVTGNIQAPSLTVEKGSSVNGKISMSKTKPIIVGDFLNLEEVSKYLEIEKSVITDWATNGRLPAKKEGSNWKFDRKIVDNWVTNEKIN